jgi:uncharacterized protein DUF349
VTSDPWGRVDEQGTVYVRTAGGERVVGSWQAGSPAEALAYFRRRYEGLVVEVDLLEHRIRETDLSPKDATASIERMCESIRTAAAVGDLDGLLARVEALRELVEARREEARAARARALEEAKAAKERIVAEAEQISAGNDWRAGGDRLRVLLDEWKASPRLDRRTDDELWHRFSHARSQFTKRRRAHYADLQGQREEARSRKEKLVAEAESLAASQDWGPTAARFRELMRDWRSAGRAQRDVDDALWARFRAAQDAFFAARNAQFAERDAGLRENLSRKARLVAEAERLLPVTDVRSARAALRSLQERWDAVGPVPREHRARIEARLASVENAVRAAEESQWRRSNPEARARAEATVTALRGSIATLDEQAEAALRAGDERAAAQAREAAAARREWLAEAERILAEFRGD